MAQLTIADTKDAVYILAFAVIMLNTDAHNPQIKKKMTVKEFIHNNRGINDKQDFPPAFLEDLYNRIVFDEIKMGDGNTLMYPDAVKKGIFATNSRCYTNGRRGSLGISQNNRLNGHTFAARKEEPQKCRQ